MDVLEIAVPQLDALNLLEERTAPLAWGQAEQRSYYFADQLFCHLGPPWHRSARAAALLRPVSAPLAREIQRWPVLSVAKDAVTAFDLFLRDPEGVGFDLCEALRCVLAPLPRWAVWCEIDSDQRPVEVGPMPLLQMLDHIEENTRRSTRGRDFLAWHMV